MYGIPLRGTACPTNVGIIQGFQSKALRIIIGAANIHGDLSIRSMKAVIDIVKKKIQSKRVGSYCP